eukprot:jgi/Picsp_1/4844/NSC_02209-R1_fha domain protein
MTSSAKESLPKFTLHVTQGPLSGKTYAMSGNSFRIGRTKSSKLQIKDPSVSERHAEMIYLEGCWQIRDLGSSNGTAVNGKQVDGTFVKIGSGDFIGFGTETVATIEIDMAIDGEDEKELTVQGFLETECQQMEDELRKKGEQLGNALRDSWLQEKNQLLSMLS